MDPIKAIKNMLAVCKTNGIVFIETFINEGYFASYWGTHQWNFMIASGNIVIWDQSNSGKVLNDMLDKDSYCDITVENPWERWLRIIITK